MNILLINPSLSKTDFETPLGLLYIANVCREAGHHVKVCDLTFGYDISHVSSYLAACPCDVVCLYVMSPMVPAALALARLVKQRNPTTVVVTGGPHPTIFPEEMLASDAVDVVVMGEGERTIRELLSAIEPGISRYAAIQGLAWKDRNNIVVNAPRELITDLDALSFPDRADLDTLEGYMHLAGIKISFGRRMLNLIASRGCSFNCSFCQPALGRIHGHQVRYRTPENVFQEIEYLREKWGVQTVWFEDDTLTFRKDWLTAFCGIMSRAAPAVSWSCNSRLDLVDEQTLRMMREAGCELIRYGLESGSQEVLDRDFEKGIRLNQVKHVFSLTRALGIRTYAYVMIGGRHETAASIEETRRFLSDIKSDFVQIAITTPLPGTRLWRAMHDDHNILIRSSRHEDIQLFGKCNYDTPALPAEEVERLYVSLFNQFHFFSLRSLLTWQIVPWMKSHLLFARFLIRLPQPNPLRVALRLFWAYGILIARLLMRLIPGLRQVEQKAFSRRMSFPDERIWRDSKTHDFFSSIFILM